MATNLKFWTIAKHEYVSRVKTKGFIISTILGPIFLLAIVLIPAIVATFSIDKTEMKIAIVDKTTSKIGQEIVKSQPNRFWISEVPPTKLNKSILDGKLDAYIILDDKSVKDNKVEVYSKGGGGVGFLTVIEKYVGGTITRWNLIQAGVDTATINLLDKEVTIETKKITEEGIQKDYAEFYSIFGYIMGFIVYMMLFMYGAMVMRGVIEEKANRIIEVLVSSAKPFDIMFGKIVGIGSVGLTQILIWIAFLFLLGLILPSVVGLFQSPENLQNIPVTTQQIGTIDKFEIPPIPVGLVVAFLAYFLLGYFLFATLFAGVGASVDQEQDAQYISTPVYLPLIIPILFVSNVMANPDGLFATIMSLIPFFSPILMTVRISATSVPAWQIVLSFILMLLTFWGCIWLSAKIYRIGILIYGKKPNFREIFRWLKQA
jgi:ABC-2 type transport system permease protein